MIIVEGMDGSGKSNLVARLKKDLGIPQAERASTSVGGPVPNVFDWACKDVHTWLDKPVEIYDRHPFISELIYGPIVRGVLDDRFFGFQGHRMMTAFRRESVVIFCKIPWEVMISNLTKNPASQMPGVLDNAKRLWLMYQTFFSQFCAATEGIVKVWDYTDDTEYKGNSYKSILAEGERHVKRWMGEDVV